MRAAMVRRSDAAMLRIGGDDGGRAIEEGRWWRDQLRYGGRAVTVMVRLGDR